MKACLPVDPLSALYRWSGDCPGFLNGEGCSRCESGQERGSWNRRKLEPKTRFLEFHLSGETPIRALRAKSVANGECRSGDERQKGGWYLPGPDEVESGVAISSGIGRAPGKSSARPGHVQAAHRVVDGQ